MKKENISTYQLKTPIKIKILIGVCILILTSTILNLGYSYKLFTDDKTSYIFETGLRKVESIGNQLNSKINELSQRSDFHATLIENPTINLSNMINSQSEILIEGTIELTNNEPIINSKFLNTKAINKLNNLYNISSDSLVSHVINQTTSNNLMNNKELILYSPHPKLRLLIRFAKTTNEKRLFFSLSDLSLSLEAFLGDPAFVNRFGDISDSVFKNEFKDLIPKLNYKNNKKGTLETILEKQNVLLSYVFINEKNILISAILKEEAFVVTKYLILKTIIFALFLLSLSVVLGIYFSSTITYPILILTNKAKEIAKGDFSTDIVIKTDDEIKILGDAFNLMGSEIRLLLENKESLISKLEDYSKNLEQMVEQRTSELKAVNNFMALMVNSLDQGLLVFDQNLNCHSLFTKACEHILGVSPRDKQLPEVLGITADPEVSTLQQWAKVVFNELISFESAAQLAPRHKTLGEVYTDSNYKNVRLEYFPMRDEDNKISNIVMIATDKTTEVRALENAKEKENYVNMILKIIGNKVQFESFVNEVEDMFKQVDLLLSQQENSLVLDQFMIFFHTLNGGFGMYNIIKLQKLTVQYETDLSSIKNNNLDRVEYISYLEVRIDNLRNLFLNFRLEIDQLLGTKFAINQVVVEIEREKVNEFNQLVKKTNNNELIKYYSSNFLQVEILEYFKIYNGFCKATAVKLQKEFSEIIFTNSNIRIDSLHLLELFHVLVHLFRNCLDHGIEDPETRKLKNKDPAGRIWVDFNKLTTENGLALNITIRDDGRGINPTSVREKFVKLNPEVDISNIADDLIIYKIFDPFFSTRDSVTSFSGRGVGMSAVKDVVSKLKGTIKIESYIDIGTSFSFTVPVEPLEIS